MGRWQEAFQEQTLLLETALRQGSGQFPGNEFSHYRAEWAKGSETKGGQGGRHGSRPPVLSMGEFPSVTALIIVV